MPEIELIAPEGCDLELGQRERAGIVSWHFPCRRKSGVWFNVWTEEPVLIHPTHWRVWRGAERLRRTFTYYKDMLGCRYLFPLAAARSVGHTRRAGDVAEWLKAAVC